MLCLWEFLNSGSTKKYGVLNHVVTNFGLVGHTYQSLCKTQVRNLLFCLVASTMHGLL
jgi:hypothetical protein